jgi:1,2-diacylglycerol 3-alpha-glucosyltransferase
LPFAGAFRIPACVGRWQPRGKGYGQFGAVERRKPRLGAEGRPFAVNTMTDLAISHNHPIHYKHLLFCELAKLGVDFEVLFTGASSDSRIERFLPKNGEYRYVIGHDGPYQRVSKIAAMQFVWRRLSELKPRVVIIGGYYDVAAWTAWLWAGRHKAKTILWFESNEFDFPRRAWKELPKRAFVSRCDLAHVYGTSNKEYVRKLGMPDERIFLKRAVVDTERFLADVDAEILKPSHKVLLYVGRFSPEKNLAFLLRAFGKLRQDPENPRMVLQLVGYGPLENELRQLAAELGISPLVQFRGRALQADLPAIYREADAFVLPSLREPWGLVVNEAMLCGLPVLVSTQCGCAADLVTPGTGWTFSPWDGVGLTSLLENLADTPRGLLGEKGRAAREIAAGYSPHNCAVIVADVVRRAIGESLAVSGQRSRSLP